MGNAGTSEMRRLKLEAVEALAADSPVDRVSRMAFPLAFVIFNIIYWYEYLYKRELHSAFDDTPSEQDHHQVAKVNEIVEEDLNVIN